MAACSRESCRRIRACGTVFDLPRLAEGATRQIAAARLADRCRFIGGDFFETIPDGFDAYLLKHVIHDWDNASALRILENCRRAMGPDGKLLIVEGVYPAAHRPLGGEPRGGGKRRQHARVHGRPPALRGGVSRPLRSCWIPSDAHRPDDGRVVRHRGNEVPLVDLGWRPPAAACPAVDSGRLRANASIDINAVTSSTPCACHPPFLPTVIRDRIPQGGLERGDSFLPAPRRHPPRRCAPGQVFRGRGC